jgi:hypothetical protein
MPTVKPPAVALVLALVPVLADGAAAVSLDEAGGAEEAAGGDDGLEPLGAARAVAATSAALAAAIRRGAERI